MSQTTMERARQTGHATMETARQAGHTVAEGAARAQGSIVRFAREQPLLLGALGLVVGGVIGAMMPRSRPENEVMGEASDSVKGAAMKTASQQFEHLQEAGGRVLEAVRSEAEQQGLAPASGEEFVREVGGKAKELVRDIGGKVSAVAAAAKQSAMDELQEEKKQVESLADEMKTKGEHALGEPAKGDERTEERDVGTTAVLVEPAESTSIVAEPIDPFVDEPKARNESRTAKDKQKSAEAEEFGVQEARGPLQSSKEPSPDESGQPADGKSVERVG